VIIFMGVAGSGKSVQGRMLADEKGYPWLSTGEFLRMLISGQKRKDMLHGKLISDKEMLQIVQKIFSMVDVSQEFVLDGFPRTSEQADWLVNQVKHGLLKISAVLHIQASEEVVRDRLLGRGRPDDHDDAIAHRFKEYQGAILPILEQFKQAGIRVFEINGEQDVLLVHKEIMGVLPE